MHARRRRHALDDDLVDAERRVLDRRGRAASATVSMRTPRRRDVELHAPAEEEAGIVVAEHEVGVGDRRLGAAEAVAGGPGIGAGRVRADLQQADLVDGRDRAAAGADLDHVDHRRLDRQARAAA